MTYTKLQKDVLAHGVVDVEGYIATTDEKFVLSKIKRLTPLYEAESFLPGYKTAKEKNDEAYAAVKAASDAATEIRLSNIPSAEFFARFTKDEWLNIKAAAASDVEVDYLLTRVMVANRINLKSPDVNGGVDYLVSKGLLAANRKAAIVSWNLS
jgi:hypothetical protein